MTKTASLRARLVVIILVPLLAIAAIAGYWTYQSAQIRAQDRFDRSLLSTALAISRDVALSGGDALSTGTRDLISDTSGGPVFYHVFAPDGAYVTGYATPPVPSAKERADLAAQLYFEAKYQGDAVRVLRLRDAMQIDGLTGDSTVTVWQDTRVRDRFVQDIARGTYVIIFVLTASVAFFVWFGVGIGLRPLNDLEAAISRRSSDELTPIQRAVPVEVSGIVGRLNALLGQLSHTLQTKNVFISNAAHQLRNPIAGILAMAEAVRSAPDQTALKERADDLIDAARHASTLANQLLTLERANALSDLEGFAVFDPDPVIRDAVATAQSTNEMVRVSYTQPSRPMAIKGDAVMIREAVANLLDNAISHGGKGLSLVNIALEAKGTTAKITVADDGVGIAADQIDTALERFGQLKPAKGSGLGLPIVQTVATQHGGSLTIKPKSDGFTAVLTLPREDAL